jgi:Cu-processing system permease protein
MWGRIATLAWWTAVEALRDRLSYVVLLFAALLVGSLCILTPLAPGAQIKVVADFGLASINLLGVLVILLSGAGLVRREIERRSLDVILCKPVSRLEYLLGKCLGLMATLAILTAAMTLVYAITLQASGFGWHIAYLKAIVASSLELLVMASLAVLFSTFTSPTLAALFTLALFAAGHLSESVLRLSVGTSSHRLLGVLRWIVPALGLFDVRGDVVHGVPVPAVRLVTAAAYAGMFALASLYVASLVFRRRDFR